MVYHGIIVSSLTCLLLPSFCFLSCFNAFPVTVSVGFPLRSFLLISVFLFVYCLFSCCIYILLHFCQVSQVVFFTILFTSYFWGFVLPSGFAFWNETKMKAKTIAKFTTSSLAWTWPGAGKQQTFFPILLLLRQLPLPLRNPVILVSVASIFMLPAPPKHQHHHHHLDDYC